MMISNMERWEGRVAVVVDFAGSPTGVAVCKDLVEHGLIVIGLTKREGMRGLEVLKASLKNVKGQLVPMECDVRDEGHINPVFRWIGENYDGIDLLINNVNTMTKGLILNEDNTPQLREIMESNIIGLCLVIREAAKLMASRPPERKNIGHIINITSTVGQKIDLFWHDGGGQGNCINGLYPASKHSSVAITEAIRQELLYMEETVKITAISPGLVESDIVREDQPQSMPALSAKDISSAILYVISVKDSVQIHEMVIKPVGDFL